MLELNPDTIACATKRTRERHPHISRITDAEIAVTCGNADHPGGHVTRFERRADGSLWGECYLRGTGEGCPAGLGHRVCYHLSAGDEGREPHARDRARIQDGGRHGQRPPLQRDSDLTGGWHEARASCRGIYSAKGRACEFTL